MKMPDTKTLLIIGGVVMGIYFLSSSNTDSSGNSTPGGSGLQNGLAFAGQASGLGIFAILIAVAAAI